MFLLDLVKNLDERGCRYAIAGGYAVAFHGVVRGTFDIDLVLCLEEKDFQAFELAMKDMKLQSQIPVDAKTVFRFRKEFIENKNLIAWSFVNPSNPVERVDVIITHDLRRLKTKRLSVQGRSVIIVSKKDLIKMKKAANRPQDLLDIAALEALVEEG